MTTWYHLLSTVTLIHPIFGPGLLVEFLRVIGSKASTEVLHAEWNRRRLAEFHVKSSFAFESLSLSITSEEFLLAFEVMLTKILVSSRS